MAPSARVLLLFTAPASALFSPHAGVHFSTPEKRAAQAASLSDPGPQNNFVAC